MTNTININMDTPCAECGEGGATGNGLCLGCTTKRITGPAKGPRRTFKKIKVDNSTGFLELAYTEQVMVGDRLCENDMGGTFRDREVHIDLLYAMQAFVPHLLVITEAKEPVEFDGMDLANFPPDVTGCSMYSVTGIALGGEDEHFGVTIIGRKVLKSRKVLNIIAPFTKFEGSEGEPPYPLANELGSAYIRLEQEVCLFLDQGKCAPVRQMALEFEDAA